MEALLKVNDISMVFGGLRAVSNFSMEIKAGELIGLIGPNGAGKTTAFNMITGVYTPTEGEIMFNGTRTSGKKSYQVTQLGMARTFQNIRLFSELSVIDNVKIAYNMHVKYTLGEAIARVGRYFSEEDEITKKALELLKIFKLEDKAYETAKNLPYGEQRRLEIARALATDPKVLLCDEATSALDPNTTHAILTLIKDINKKLGITVVVITHQMSVVEEICDSVAILDGGVVVEQGEVREIFANPKTAAARRLVAPNGGSAARDLSSFAPDDHVVRVTFNGSSAAKPLVASLAAEKGILVSVLSADTRDLSGQCYGSMLLKLPRDTEQAKQAAAYMRSQNGVTVEEVTGE